MVKKTSIISGIVLFIALLVLLFAFRGRFCAPVVAPSAPITSAAGGNFEKDLSAAQVLIQKGELLSARSALMEILVRDISHPGIEGAQKMLEGVNMKVILSAIDLPQETAYREVKKGDTLSMIADEYRTTVEMIKKQNGLTSDVIRPGQRLRIWTGRIAVLVDKSQNLLTLRSNGEVIKTYRVSTGKNNITPVGTFKIINKLKNPAWTHEGKVYPADSPENILGTRWMGFDIPGYGIHGTTQPQSIGEQATAGCVRMQNEQVEEIYDLLPVNTEVVVID